MVVLFVVVAEFPPATQGLNHLATASELYSLAVAFSFALYFFFALHLHSQFCCPLNNCFD